mmetsp:Transcript_41714/g.74847  ORF Transcript_41714/g.74847 Transcript_41714/m.74847 type:complete len:618 (+) Transcript_41714:36-1889(+)
MSFTFRRPSIAQADTDLVRYAHSQRLGAPTSSTRARDEDLLDFPMYTVSIRTLLQMTTVLSFEHLLATDSLSRYDESMGRAIFVSHQWVSHDHPDPRSEQLKILQSAIRNLSTGQTGVRVPMPVEMLYGRLPTPTSADFVAKPLYFWYDYMCCPQGKNQEAVAQRHLAIGSIVSYVSRCEYFAVLAPPLLHENQETMEQESWAGRAWCRTERLARELATRDDGFLLVIESSTHVTLVSHKGRHLDAPGAGELTMQADIHRLAAAISQMVWSKLHFYLEKGDLHKYRFLLNEHARCCFLGLGLRPFEGLVPGFAPRSDPWSDPNGILVERFLHDNGFRHLHERDSGGWTPLCYAVMSAERPLLAALLQQRADCNDRILKTKKDLVFPRNMCVLSLATNYGNNEAVKLLIAERAFLQRRDNLTALPVHYAASTDNLEGLQLLIASRASPRKKSILGWDVITVACAFGSVQILEEILIRKPQAWASVSYGLHFALMFEGGSSTCVSALLRARADVNQKFHSTSPVMRMYFGIQALRHRMSKTSFSAVAFHHEGATPLMFSILNGYFGASALLLEAKAEVDIRNSRGTCAADLARTVPVPIWLTDVLLGFEEVHVMNTISM